MYNAPNEVFYEAVGIESLLHDWPAASQGDQGMPIEPRYIVIKRRDAYAYLTLEEQNLIHALAMKVERMRKLSGRSCMNALVIEEDWPEYHQVRDMLTQRIALSQQEQQGQS